MIPYEAEGTMQHLDDDAFAELSIGEALNAKAQAHLESCAACREEMARFQESVGSFSMASLAWSEKKSEALPPLRPAAKGKAAGSRIPRLVPALSCALVLLLLILGVTVPVQKMHFTTLHGGDGSKTASLGDDDPAGLNSPEQIAKDNQLMADVNYELTHSQAVLLTQYDRQRSGRAMTETRKRSQ